jgi:GPI mannosyltransferase 3
MALNAPVPAAVLESREVPPLGTGSRIAERRISRVLALILLFALAIRVSVGLFLPNMSYPDEVFQTLEPAHSLAYHHGIVTWEYRMGYRSWVLPGLLAGIMRLTDWIKPGSEGYLIGVVSLLCLLSLTAVLFAFWWSYRAAGVAAGIVAAVACGFWFELVFYAPKAFTEVIAAHIFLPAVYLAAYGRRWAARSRLFVAGLLCGCVLGLRVQFALAVAILVFYTCGRQWKGKWLPMLAGIALTFSIFGLVDGLTWAYPFQSTILYLSANLLGKHHGPHFSISPWYFYLIMLAKYLGPMLVLAILGARKSPLLAWLVVAVVLPHCLIGHKEYRFIYPALPLLITLAAIGLVGLLTSMAERFPMPKRFPAVAAIGTGFCLLTSAAYATHTHRWTGYSGNLKAFQTLSRESGVCGVGLYGIPWENSGGYAYLHQPVSLYPIASDAEFDSLAPGFNYLVANASSPTLHDVYQLQRCWSATCLYKRPGTCANLPGRDLNAVLQSKGE